MSNKDSKALFNIGYGLYVVTSNDGNRDNGLIVNTVMQQTSSPERISVTINKSNYSAKEKPYFQKEYSDIKEIAP